MFSNVKFQSPFYEEKIKRFYLSPFLLNRKLAYKKLCDIPVKKDQMLWAFDTLVYRFFCIYGKPRDYQEAYTFLKQLNNKTHKVVTTLCIKFQHQIVFFYELSYVRMKRLNDKEIRDYLETNEWRDKAGGYGIQGKGRKIIEWYKGNYYNIVGLPLNVIINLLQ